MNLGRFTLLSLALLAQSACTEEDPAPDAVVYFVLDAPLCSSVIPVQFFIDSVQVGTDTFRVNLAPNHTVSSGFATNGGPHILGARGVNGDIWPDTAVTIRAGKVFHDSLPFYCS